MVRLLVSTIDQLLTDMLSAATLENNVADILSVTKLSIPSPTILFIQGWTFAVTFVFSDHGG
jgi:hypothetical protein